MFVRLVQAASSFLTDSYVPQQMAAAGTWNMTRGFRPLHRAPAPSVRTICFSTGTYVASTHSRTMRGVLMLGARSHQTHKLNNAGDTELLEPHDS